MLRLLDRVHMLFKSLVRVVLPFASQARSSPGLWSALLVVAHVVVIAAIAAGLYWLNVAHRLYEHVGVRSPFLAKSWLSILFLLLYALAG